MNSNKIVEFILQKKAVLATSILTAAGAVVLGAAFIYISLMNEMPHHIFQDVQITCEDNPVPQENSGNNGNCFIKMKIPLRSDGALNSWKLENGRHGAQYDIYIQNDTQCSIKNWTLKLSVPENSQIDSSWSGLYTKEKNIITIKASGKALNEVISPQSSCKLGFVLYSDSFLKDSSVSLEAKFQRSPFSYALFTASAAVTIAGIFLTVFMAVNYSILKHQQAHAEKEISELLKLCASFIDTRDAYTKRHSLNVAAYSKMLAEELGYSKSFQKNIYNCVFLHYIGKVLIPRAILCKPEKLSDEEWTEMKKHTVYGAEILKDFTGIKNVHSVVLYHHERYDGKGYMKGLKGEEIPLEARIVCVADSFDAMATDRAYRPHLSKEIIISELKKGKGTQFDPEIAQAMLNIIEKGKIAI